MNCPICENANACSMTCGSGRGACWCFEINVARDVIACLADSEIAYSCLCRGCLTSLVVYNGAGATPREALDRVMSERQPVAA
jgi:hypothetical protein